MEEASGGFGILAFLLLIVVAVALISGAGSSDVSAPSVPVARDAGLTMAESDYRLHEKGESGIEEIDGVDTSQSHAESKHFEDVTNFWACMDSGEFTAFEVGTNRFYPSKGEQGRKLQVCVHQPDGGDGKVFVRVLKKLSGRWFEQSLYIDVSITLLTEAFNTYVFNNAEAIGEAIMLYNAVPLPTE